MFHLTTFEPIDYLVIGHVTLDQTPAGPVLGGTAAYSALTARALGLRVGIVTAWAGEIAPGALAGIALVSAETQESTRFENIYTSGNRVQYIRKTAPRIDLSLVPQVWRGAKIIHIGPVAQEADSILPDDFQPALLGLTPQGWMRSWAEDGKVNRSAWKESGAAMQAAGATIFSAEDVSYDEEQIEILAHQGRLVVVTEGAAGCRLFWNGDSRRFRAPAMEEIDATGAGDIFAASFFVRLLQTRDPWEAARFAVNLAAHSVNRRGLLGIPTQAEINTCLMEILD
ncbi:MAG: PfkB family carbohydrate kinase [Anaerolineales bacterium]|jgi:sugar/nucleoside kinase (ribokinase family)|nr:PfkB family carbohydrate kinase [Anaerolineales bacterium]